MDIKKINENQVRCAITEEEITEMGFDINDVIANTEETQKFMRVLLEKIEEQEIIDIESLSPMVRAELFPDRTMNIIFGGGMDTNPEQMFGELMDRLKEKLSLHERPKKKENEEVSGKKSSEKIEEIDETETLEEEEKASSFALECDSLDKVIYLSKLFVEIPKNSLYKMNDNYYLLLEFEKFSKERFRLVAFAATEYNCRPIATLKALAYIKEHGKCIMEENAIGKLMQL